MGTTLPMTSTTDADDESSTDIATSQPSTDSSASVADTSSSSSTVGLEDCGAVGCEECTDCVIEAGQDCEDESQACAMLTGCTTAAICLRDCGVSGICGTCCEGLDDDAAVAAHALNSCRSDTCLGNGACGGWTPQNCP